MPESAQAFLRFQNDILIGSRAVGLAGAYTAIANDASALHYNPAGLAFAHRAISLSVNGYYYRRSQLDGFSFADNIKNVSQGTVASFFGGVSKVKLAHHPLVVGFAVFVPHDERTDRTNRSSGEIFQEVDNIAVIKTNSNATHYAVGAAKALSTDHAFGLSLAIVDYNFSDQTYGNTFAGPLEKDTDQRDLFLNATSNASEKLDARMLEFSIGHLWKFKKKWAYGATIGTNKIVSYDYSKSTDVTSSVVTREGTVTFPEGASEEEIGSVSFVRRNDTSGSDLELEEWPSRLRLGVSFQDGVTTVSFDVSHHTQTKSNKIEGKRDAVTNFHLGWEWSKTPNRRYSVGFFTNYDAQPDTLKTESGDIAVEKLNQFGVSLSAAAVIFEADYQASLAYQQGDSQLKDPLTQQSLTNKQYRVMAYLSITN